MSLVDWVQDTASETREYGIRGLRDSLLQFYAGYLRRRRGEATGLNVFEEDWDVLVILDALRTDLVEEVHDEYECLSTETVSSVGRTSMEWMAQTFVDEYTDTISETAYITGNPHTANHLENHCLQYLDEVWRYAWDAEIGTVRPEPVTDRAVATHRELHPDRMIVHYMQPHYPFVTDPITSGIDLNNVERGDQFLGELWDGMKRGVVSRDEVWTRYRNNLEYVLEHVGTLLENIDAEQVVITADHGTAYGECGLYGHNEDNPLAVVNEVPWCRTEATDNQTFNPELEPGDQSTDQANVEERLQSLGYKT